MLRPNRHGNQNWRVSCKGCASSDGSKEYMAEGALMQYGIDHLEAYRLAPYYVDRILKGAKPSDLPVHLPTRFKLTINRKTATALRST